MTEPERHDWQQIIYELKRMYRETEGRELLNNKLGLMIGIAHQSVDILEKRGEPRHLPGEKLIALHAEYFRKTSLTVSDAPIVRAL